MSQTPSMDTPNAAPQTVSLPAHLSQEEVTKWVRRLSILLAIEIAFALVCAFVMSLFSVVLISGGPDVDENTQWIAGGVSFVVSAGLFALLPILSLVEVRHYRLGKSLVINWITFILMALGYGVLIILPIIHFYFIYKLTMQRKAQPVSVQGETEHMPPSQTPSTDSPWEKKPDRPSRARRGPKGIEKVGC